MKRTVFQHPELRDANDNIIQQGAFGKNTALANSTNDGWIDYVANDLEALYNNTMGGTGGEINTETITGKTGTITNLTATTVKAGTLTADALNGPLTGNVTGTADKAVADGDGNNIVNTYVTKSAVQGELTNYLPLSGGTLTGVVNGVTPPNGDNSKKLATTEFVNATAQQAKDIAQEAKAVADDVVTGWDTKANVASPAFTGTPTAPTPTAGDNSTKIATTEFVNAKAENYLPLSGGTLTGDVDITGDLSVSGAIYSSSGGVLPGTVTAFSGTFKDGYPVNKNTGLVDKEWHLCDGTNGTPDLQNRFIYGGDGTNNGNTGGEKSVTLSMEQIPKHHFSGTTSTGGGHNHQFASARDTSHTDRKTTKFEDTPDFGRTRAWLKNDYTENAGEHNHTFTTNTLGGGQPHNNMPPYYVLAYIMKL